MQEAQKELQEYKRKRMESQFCFFLKPHTPSPFQPKVPKIKLVQWGHLKMNHLLTEREKHGALEKEAQIFNIHGSKGNQEIQEYAEYVVLWILWDTHWVLTKQIL